MAEETHSAPRHVLVVDDEAILRRMITMVLEGAGYKVSTASSGREALELIAVQRPDLVTLDVMMPEISGMEIAQRLAADEATRDLPVVLVTAIDGASDPGLRRQLLECHGRLLQKPFSRRQLLDAIGEALGPG